MSTVLHNSPAPAERSLLRFTPLARLDSARELVSAIQRLSLARTIEDVQEIVRSAARRLTGADGATFVLRDGTRCYYAEEDAISPLWKGQRFPMEVCISGWAMLNRQSVVIEDIYADERIPHDAYRPTFVKSLAMVPIRTLDPVGAIGNYWATQRRPSEEEVELLQALADSTAVAMENVRVYQELEQRVAARTAELMQVLNTLAHEVRTPLAAGLGILRMVLRAEDFDEQRVRADLGDVDIAVGEVIDVVNRQLQAARSQAGAIDVKREQVDLAVELAALRAMFRALASSREVALVVEEPKRPIFVHTDRALLGHILRNLVGNALKFTDSGEVRVSACHREEDDSVALTVSDTGIGIAQEDVHRIFQQWQQVGEAQQERPAGSGLGLPLVLRLVDSLGGHIELDSAPGRGSKFTVTLPHAHVSGQDR